MTKKEILKLLQSGKITDEEALKLLDEEVEVEVVDRKFEEEVVEKPKSNRKAKFLVIRTKSSKSNTNIKIPLALIKLAKQFNLKTEGIGDIDYDALMKFIDEEGTGKFIDVHDEDEDVEISVE